MGNDIHYLIIFTTVFFGLGLVAPLLNAEFPDDVNYEENTFEEPTIDDVGSPSILDIPTVGIILNIIVFPFWTFGFDWWVNLWILLPIRIPFWFLIARNIWVGGGG